MIRSQKGDAAECRLMPAEVEDFQLFVLELRVLAIRQKTSSRDYLNVMLTAVNTFFWFVYFVNKGQCHFLTQERQPAAQLTSVIAEVITSSLVVRCCGPAGAPLEKNLRFHGQMKSAVSLRRIRKRDFGLQFGTEDIICLCTVNSCNETRTFRAQKYRKQQKAAPVQLRTSYFCINMTSMMAIS